MLVTEAMNSARHQKLKQLQYRERYYWSLQPKSSGYPLLPISMYCSKILESTKFSYRTHFYNFAA